MKQAKLTLLAVLVAAALFSLTLVTGEPAAASTCQYYCQEQYEECLGEGIPQSGCERWRDRCLADCP